MMVDIVKEVYSSNFLTPKEYSPSVVMSTMASTQKATDSSETTSSDGQLSQKNKKDGHKRQWILTDGKRTRSQR
ncbi:hypothetical protein PAMP_001595 [Pampus punctatissimus]